MAHQILILTIGVGVFALFLFFVVYYIESQMVGTLTYECSRCNKEISSETAPKCPNCKRPMNIIQEERLF